jgi:hypothetical protein
LAEIVTTGLDFANEAAGVRQFRDRLLFCKRVRDQLQRLDAGVIDASEQLAQRFVQGLDRVLANTHGRSETQGQILDRFDQRLCLLPVVSRHPLVVDRTRPRLQLLEGALPSLHAGADDRRCRRRPRRTLLEPLHELATAGKEGMHLLAEFSFRHHRGEQAEDCQ